MRQVVTPGRKKALVSYAQIKHEATVLLVFVYASSLDHIRMGGQPRARRGFRGARAKGYRP